MSVLVQEEVRPENVAHPIVVTVKLMPDTGGWWEAPTAPLINELAKRLSEPIKLEGLVVTLRLDEISLQGTEGRVQFA